MRDATRLRREGVREGCRRTHTLQVWADGFLFICLSVFVCQVILYTTISGTIGALLPFASRRTKDFFFILEMEMRKLYDFHFKRDHIAFRSYYHPVKEVIDGDLCEQFSAMPAAKQRTVSVGRTPIEIMKLLEDTRNSIV